MKNSVLFFVPAWLGFAPLLIAAAGPACAGGMSVSEFTLAVQAPDAKSPLALREVHAVGAGFKILYTPGQLPANVDKKAEVAIILAPVNHGGAKKPQVVVLDPQSALKRAEWESPVAVDVAGLVYGPQGLDKSRVKKLVRDDAELISQLAEYAEKTALAESLIQQLKTSSAGAAAPSTTLEAAVKGLSDAPAPTAVDRSAPPDQQAAALLKALNPAVATYDPLAPSPTARVAQSAGLAAAIAGLFFGNTVGLATGSAALAANLSSLISPNTEFRSSFAQPASEGNLALCAKREAHQPRTKIAYLWAVRVPNTPAPALRLKAVRFLPQGGAGEIPVELQKETAWASINAVKPWTLNAVSGPASAPVHLVGDAKSQLIQLDLAKTQLAPGEYKLAGVWDWAPFTAEGTLHVASVPDLGKAAIEAASRDRLVHGSGEVEVRLTGVDFEFVDAVQLEPAAPGEMPLELTPKLPKGHGAGPQETLSLSLNTTTLPAGHYKLILSESGDKKAELPLRILPPVPVIAGLPLRANLEENRQHLRLKGTGLDRVEGLTSTSARFELSAPGDAERTADVHLASGLQAGQTLDLQMKVEGMTQPVVLKAALLVAPPRPRILAATMSRVPNLGIEQRPNELPADTFLTYSLRVARVDGQAEVRLACEEPAQTLAPQDLRPGEKGSGARLDQAGAGVLFLSLLPGAIGQPGCELAASVETVAGGISDSWKLGRVVRLPRIDKFTVTDEKVADGQFAGLLEGEHLETIGKVGWDATHGLSVDSLPAPVAGDALRQTLRVVVAWPSPSPQAPLYVWLQGEDAGRRTETRY
jgi:hypothetical protein